MEPSKESEKGASKRHSGRTLDSEMIMDGLYSLGTSSISGKYVFLKLVLQDKELADLSALHEYQHLQHMDLSNNKITDFSVLAALPQLKSLNLSSNQITDVTEITRKSEASASGEALGAASLEVLNLCSNQVKKIPGLVKCRYLRELLLDHNQVKQISGLDDHYFLRNLSQRNNCLDRTAGIVGKNIRHLRLDNNNIDTLGPAFKTLPQLENLTLDNNKISSLENLSHCLSLRFLSIQNSHLVGIRQLEFLVALSFLEEVRLDGNDVCDSMDYRARAVYRLNRLTTLDGETVSSEEKVKAENVYGADISGRRTVHMELVPQIPFVNPFRVWLKCRDSPKIIETCTIAGTSQSSDKDAAAFVLEAWSEGEGWSREKGEGEPEETGAEGYVIKGRNKATASQLRPLYFVPDNPIDGKQLLQNIQIVCEPGQEPLIRVKEFEDAAEAKTDSTADAIDSKA